MKPTVQLWLPKEVRLRYIVCDAKLAVGRCVRCCSFGRVREEGNLDGYRLPYGGEGAEPASGLYGGRKRLADPVGGRFQGPQSAESVSADYGFCDQWRRPGSLAPPVYARR